MEVRFTKCLFAALVSALCLFAASTEASAQPNVQNWMSARSAHFLVIGDAGEQELRGAAARLEQFRAAFARLPGVEHADSVIPTTVFVFRDDNSYSPFRPIYRGETDHGVAGYFQTGAQSDYIALSVEQDRAEGTSRTLLHEYAHLLFKHTYRSAPLWFKEGLAQYYSTAVISDADRKLTLGRPLKDRLRFIRGRALLRLPVLFAVDTYSPYYHEQEPRSVFYAQSWALVHYLLNGAGAERRAQLSRYLELLAAGTPAEDAFGKTFQTDFDKMELELAAYVSFGVFAERVETLGGPVEYSSQSQLRSLSQAETLAHLGDLLLRSEREDEAEAYLRRAVALDANNVQVRLTLGVMRLRQNRFAEAALQLRQAAAGDSQSHLARFHLAETLFREGPETDATVKGFEERTRELRAELNKAIELAPKFPEAYRLLALVELERGGRLDEAATHLKKALALAPASQESTFLLARVQLRAGQFGAARQLSEALAAQAPNQYSRGRIQALLESIAAGEKEAATQLESAQNAALAEASLGRCDMPDPGPQFKKLRFAGEQVCGRLVQIECEDKNVMLFIEARDRTLRLRSDALNGIRFITYTSEVKTGQLTCGLRDPSNPVLVTYRPSKGGTPKGGTTPSDGEVVAVEFVPADWHR